MRTKTYTTLLICMVISVSGCERSMVKSDSMIRGGSRFTSDSVEPSGALSRQQPLNVSKADVSSINTIAIYLPIHLLKNYDDKRIYNAKLDIFVSELKKSNRFKLISSSRVKRKAKQLGLLQDSEIKNEEEIGEITQVASALGAHATILFGNRQEKMSIGGNIFKYMVERRVSVPMVETLKIISAKTGKVLWEQEHSYILNSGKVGIKNLSDDELKKMLRPLIIPLTNNLLDSFDPAQRHAVN